MSFARLAVLVAVTGLVALAAGFSATSAQAPAPLPGISADTRP